ncbi:MAG: GAF domain-containing protein [Cyanobacteria bacterium SZAS LIN-3]|nr:GAF domain-containing protein [Cyanobacteria bacterium SZAS LIN-3]
MNSAKVINEILRMMRDGLDMRAVLSFAAEALTSGLEASRCVIWMIEGDQLVASEEFSATSILCFEETALSAQESTMVVLDFLSRFPDESGRGVIAVDDVLSEPNRVVLSPTMASLMELGKVRSRLMCQLRSWGVFSGFVDLHYCEAPRLWSEVDMQALEEVALALSVLVQLIADKRKIAADVTDLKTINAVSEIFAQAREAKTALASAASLMAEKMGFEHCQIYLRDLEGAGDNLIAQIESTESKKTIALSQADNPFAAVVASAKPKFINVSLERSTKRDPCFNYEVAVLFPLVTGGNTVGVIGLWRRLPRTGSFLPQSHELCMTIAQMIATFATKVISP